MIPAITQSATALNRFAQGFATNARNINSAFTQGQEAFRTVEQPENNNSSEMASTYQDDSSAAVDNRSADIARETAQAIINKNGIKASVAVIRTADQTVGTLLDVMG